MLKDHTTTEVEKRFLGQLETLEAVAETHNPLCSEWGRMGGIFPGLIIQLWLPLCLLCGELEFGAQENLGRWAAEAQIHTS